MLQASSLPLHATTIFGLLVIGLHSIIPSFITHLFGYISRYLSTIIGIIKPGIKSPPLTAGFFFWFYFFFFAVDIITAPLLP